MLSLKWYHEPVDKSKQYSNLTNLFKKGAKFCFFALKWLGLAVEIFLWLAANYSRSIKTLRYVSVDLCVKMYVEISQ